MSNQHSFVYRIFGIPLSENINGILEEMKIRYPETISIKIWRNSSDVFFATEITSDLEDRGSLEHLLMDDLSDSVFATIKNFEEISLLYVFSREDK